MQLGECRLQILATDIARHPIQMMQRHKQAVAFGVFKQQILALAFDRLDRGAGVDRQLDRAAEYPNAVVLVHNRIAGLPVGEAFLGSGPPRPAGGEGVRASITKNLYICQQRHSAGMDETAWQGAIDKHHPALRHGLQVGVRRRPRSRFGPQAGQPAGLARYNDDWVCHVGLEIIQDWLKLPCEMGGRLEGIREGFWR